MRNDYTSYRRRSRIRLVLMVISIFALITLVAFLFVYIIQRNQPQKAVLISSSSSSSTVSKVSSANSSGTSTSNAAFTQMTDWRLVLVNSTNKLPNGFQSQLVHISDKIYMDKRIVQDYNNMCFAAHIEKVSWWIAIAYRSEDQQKGLYNDEIAKNLQNGLSSSSAISKAKLAVQPPGYSEHHTGLAMDLNDVSNGFDKTKAFAWLQKHAAEYGFVLRYPKDKESITKIMYEPWHYRYVGIEHAKKMKELNMCLEEYIEYLKKNSLD